MSSSAFSPTEAAEHLGVSPSTVKNWAVRLPVPSFVDDDGTRRFPAEALAMLALVKRLRDEERSYATIRRVIEPMEPITPIDLAAIGPPDAALAASGASASPPPEGPRRAPPPPEKVAETEAAAGS